MGPCSYCPLDTTFATCRDCNDDLHDEWDRAYERLRDSEFGL